MNWFPTFLNPWFAAAAAAIAIPSLLILYFLKLRRREMAVSSTLLWKKAIQDLQVNAPFQKLRRNLLLFLQLLLLLLLLLALSRPVSNYTPGAGKMTVILIDRSASMAAQDVDGGKRTRLEEAKRRARDLVETIDRKSSAMVIAFDEEPRIMQKFTSDVPALKSAIDSIQQTDRKTRLKTAYQLAEAQSNFNPDQLRSLAKPDVWVYSDGRILDPDEVNIRTGEVHYERIGRQKDDPGDSSKFGNVGIVAMNARRNYEQPTQVQIFARLANYGTQPVKADVQLSIDDRVRSIAATNLLPESWTDEQRDEAERTGGGARESVEFTIDLSDSAIVRIEQMSKEGDQLSADDTAQVVVPPPKSQGVLLVTEGNYFLERLLDSLRLKSPATLRPSAYEEKVPSEYDLIIFDRYSPKKLPAAGNFIYFGSVGPALAIKPEKDPATQKNVVVSDSGVLDWRRDHPILRDRALDKLYVAEALKLDVPRESEVLIDGTKGPLVVMHREGPSLHLVFAFDVLQSNLPFMVSFPIVMHNALQYMAIGSDMDVRQAFAPGATPRIPRANLEKVLTGAASGGDNAPTLRINGPGGSRDIKIPPSGDFALPALDKVGVYTLDPAVPQYERIAVNLLDPSESNLLPLDTAPGGVGEAVGSAAGKSRLELWWWIVACAALPLLMIEWWVYTRRVHL
ncbi:MAG: VWA domain-containing protein [Chthoniobacterales bacterium]|nr:VWA domain-containing protein [Chthoniobacterales bacterium]